MFPSYRQRPCTYLSMFWHSHNITVPPYTVHIGILMILAIFFNRFIWNFLFGVRDKCCHLWQIIGYRGPRFRITPIKLYLLIFVIFMNCVTLFISIISDMAFGVCNEYSYAKLLIEAHIFVYPLYNDTSQLSVF